MSCSRFADLIPWYVANNLNAEQRAGLEAHVGGCPACREEVRTLTSLRGTVQHYAETDHVPSEQLVAHANGETAADALPMIERHLAGCDDCRQDLELLRAAGEDEARPRARWAGTGWRMALAAASVVLVGVVTLRLIGVGADSPSVSGISAHVIEAQLRGGAESGTVLRGEGPWLVAVRLPIHAPGGAYRTTVRTEAGNAPPGVEPVTAASDGDGFVPLLVAALDPGDYRVTFDSVDEPSQETYHTGFSVAAEAE